MPKFPPTLRKKFSIAIKIILDQLKLKRMVKKINKNNHLGENMLLSLDGRIKIPKKKEIEQPMIYKVIKNGDTVSIFNCTTHAVLRVSNNLDNVLAIKNFNIFNNNTTLFGEFLIRSKLDFNNIKQNYDIIKNIVLKELKAMVINNHTISNTFFHGLGIDIETISSVFDLKVYELTEVIENKSNNKFPYVVIFNISISITGI